MKNPMKNLLLLLFILICSLSVVANNNIDSLRSQLTQKHTDKELASLYFKLGYQYVFINHDTARMFFNKSLYLLSDSGNRKLTGKIYNLLSFIYNIESQFDSVIYYSRKAIHWFDSVNDADNIVYSKIRIASAFSDKYLLDSAFIELKEAQQINHVSKRYKVLLSTAIAELYINKEDYINAVKQLSKFKKLIDGLDDKKLAIKYYIDLGLSYKQTNNKEKALFVLSKAKYLSQEINSLYYLTVVNINIAYVYQDMNKPAQAIPLFKQAANYMFKENNLRRYLILLSRISISYSLTNQPDSALYYIDTIKQYLPDLKTSKKYKTVITHYYKALRYYYEKRNNYKEALHYYDLQVKMRDSLTELKNVDKLNKLRVVYETEKKLQENVRLKQLVKLKTLQTEKEQALKKFFRILVILLTVLFISIFIIFIQYRRITLKKRALNAEKILRLDSEKHLVEQQKEAMKRELVLHSDLVKTLNNHLLQQATLSSNMTIWLKTLKPFVNAEGKKYIQSKLAEINAYSFEQNWQVFERNFAKVYPGLQKAIRENIPGLSITEYRMLLFLVMKLKSSEIALITFQSASSIRTAKFRLRQKLQVKTDDEVLKIIEKFIKP